MTLQTDRILLAAQQFLESITFSLNEPEAKHVHQKSFSPAMPTKVDSIGRKRGDVWNVLSVIKGQEFLQSNSLFKKRLLFIISSGTPTCFASVIPFELDGFSTKNRRFDYLDLSFIEGPEDVKFMSQTKSFGHLLAESSSSSSENSSSSSFSSSSSSSSPSSGDESLDFVAGPSHYDPIFLDDPTLQTGKHRTVIALPSFLGSISNYISKSELRRELDDQFRQKHPNLHPSLTLSQIRGLKQGLLGISLILNIELSTVAKSYAFFEKLLLCGKVIRINRKIVGACCLILAIKSNDSRTIKIERVLKELCSRLRILNGQQIIKREFAVFAALKFSLHLPQHEYLPHFERIFSSLEYETLQEYLGERMYRTWNRHVHEPIVADQEEEEEEAVAIRVLD